MFNYYCCVLIFQFPNGESQPWCQTGPTTESALSGTIDRIAAEEDYLKELILGHCQSKTNQDLNFMVRAILEIKDPRTALTAFRAIPGLKVTETYIFQYSN